MFVRSSILLLMVIVFLTAAAESAVITAKSDGTSDYPTIQDAIDNTTDADEVVLQPSNYTGYGTRAMCSNANINVVRILLRFCKSYSNNRWIKNYTFFEIS